MLEHEMNPQNILESVSKQLRLCFPSNLFHHEKKKFFRRKIPKLPKLADRAGFEGGCATPRWVEIELENG